MPVQIDVDLRSRFPAVRDQRARPTCLAFATSAVHSAIREGQLHLSPEYLHHHSVLQMNSRHFDGGVTMTAASTALTHDGQPEEHQCPYRLQRSAQWIPLHPTVPIFRRRSAHQICAFTTVEQYLQDSQPVVVGLDIDLDFLMPPPPEYVIQDNGSPIVGAHAVALVALGRHNGERVFLVRNSWGMAWADAGHAWITSDRLARHGRTMMILSTEE